MQNYNEILNFEQTLNNYEISNDEKNQILDNLLKNFCNLRISLKITPKKCYVCMVCKKPFENNDVSIYLTCSCLQRVHKNCLEIKMKDNFFSILSCAYCGTPIAEELLRNLKQNSQKNPHRVKNYENFEKKDEECCICKRKFEKTNVYEFKCKHKVCLKCLPIFLDYQLQTNDINEIQCPKMNCFVKIINEEMIEHLFISFEELKSCEQTYVNKKKNQELSQLKKTQSEQILKLENEKIMKKKSENIETINKKENHHYNRKGKIEQSCIIQ